MAINQLAVFEIRSTGNDLNGGGFVSGGTDYSQQDAAQKEGTDLAIHATTNTDVKPTGAGVAAADVGNIIQIASGTGWTPGFYQIASIQGLYWRLDRSPSAAGNANTATYKMGGALASIGAYGLAGPVAGQQIAIKYGSYTISTASTNVSGGCYSNSACVVFFGYSTDRTPFNSDAKPTITVGAGVSTTVVFNTTLGAFVMNVAVDGNNETSSRAAAANCYNCDLLNLTNGGVSGIAVKCSATGCSSVAIFSGISIFCTAYGNSIACFSSSAIGCVAWGNTATPFLSGASAVVMNCVSALNTGATTDGFADNSTALGVAYINCIAESNGRNGLTLTASQRKAHLAINTATYGNAGVGVSVGSGIATGSIAASASVFVDAANQDFRLNNTANAGALLRSAGFPTLWPGCSVNMVNYLDIGAAAVRHVMPSPARVANGVDCGDGATPGTGLASTAATLFGAGENLDSAILLAPHVVGDVTGAASAQTIFIDTEM